MMPALTGNDSPKEHLERNLPDWFLRAVRPRWSETLISGTARNLIVCRASAFFCSFLCFEARVNPWCFLFVLRLFRFCLDHSNIILLLRLDIPVYTTSLSRNYNKHTSGEAWKHNASRNFIMYFTPHCTASLLTHSTFSIAFLFRRHAYLFLVSHALDLVRKVLQYACGFRVMYISTKFPHVHTLIIWVHRSIHR